MTIALVGLTESLADQLTDTFPGARYLPDPHLLVGENDGIRVVVQDVRYDKTVPASVEGTSFGVWQVDRRLRPPVHVLLSSLRMFDAYDPGWAITSSWYPRPGPEPEQLEPYLAELTLRELTRARPVAAAILRVDSPAGRLTNAEINQLVAVISDLESCSQAQLRYEHSARRGRRTPGSPPSIPDRPALLRRLTRPRRAVMFGAGGPLGAAATAAATAEGLPLLLTDSVPLAARAAGPPQTPGAPLPMAIAPPHSEAVLDITDAAAVDRVARDADCLINCAVVRNDPRTAFRVNVAGAHAVMRAAVRAGIPRVVHTGPAFVVAPHPYGYADDRGIAGPVPPRAGDDVYLLSKLLALEVCRIFAERHRIACLALLYIQMTDPVIGREDVHPFVVSWEDAGRAIIAAATVEEMSEPFQELNVLVQSPHGRFDPGATWRTLGISPRHRLDHLWYNDAGRKVL